MLATGGRLQLRCGDKDSALPPATFLISGIVDFPFDDAGARTAATSLDDIARLCGETNDDRVGDPAGAIAAGRRRGRSGGRHPRRASSLHVVTNEELVERFSRVEFSYFRQISVVLATVTLFFGFLLIAVLLTVSVNQRLGEVAALRALGLSRWRVVAGVLIESVILVFTGGLLAIPLGATVVPVAGRYPAGDARRARRSALLRVRAARARSACRAPCGRGAGCRRLPDAHRRNAADRLDAPARGGVVTPSSRRRTCRGCFRWRPGQSPL